MRPLQPVDKRQGGAASGYIRKAFWRGYAFESIDKANADLLHWFSDIANRRQHGTHGQRVDMRWQQESRSFSPVPEEYDTAVSVYRKVYKDCLISYNASCYQVPSEAVAKKVLLKIKDGLIRIYEDDRLLITHTVSQQKGRMITDPAIMEQILELRRA